MVLIDAWCGSCPGSMGAAELERRESFTDHLLEYPHYTRPQLWKAAGSGGADLGRTAAKSPLAPAPRPSG